MNEKQEKQLIADVEALKAQVASQMPHTILLLALLKTGSLTAHPSNVETEINRVPLPPEIERLESSVRAKARDLLRLYFPEKYIPA